MRMLSGLAGRADGLKQGILAPLRHPVFAPATRKLYRLLIGASEIYI
jgi:hypothetical protein